MSKPPFSLLGKSVERVSKTAISSDVSRSAPTLAFQGNETKIRSTESHLKSAHLAQICCEDFSPEGKQNNYQNWFTEMLADFLIRTVDSHTELLWQNQASARMIDSRAGHTAERDPRADLQIRQVHSTAHTSCIGHLWPRRHSWFWMHNQDCQVLQAEKSHPVLKRQILNFTI